MTIACIILALIVLAASGLVSYALCRIAGLADRHLEEYNHYKNYKPIGSHDTDPFEEEQPAPPTFTVF